MLVIINNCVSFMLCNDFYTDTTKTTNENG